MIKNILLVGPKLNISSKKAYGGGTGGYTRNMKVYLTFFKLNKFNIIPFFHTIRGEHNFWIFTKPFRLVIDSFVFLKELFTNNIEGVHILAQYRGAIYREYMILCISRLFSKPVLYEIKAGSFKKTYNNSGNVYKKIVKFIVKNSKILMVEGKSDMLFLKKEFQKESTYFPNIIPNEEIPDNTHIKFQNECVRLLFVGYAYEGKGIFELYNACEAIGRKGLKISLTIIGQLSIEFEKYIYQTNNRDFEINILGKLSHQEVLEQFKLHDVYCYPSKHEGEGHNNTINEALMNELVICSSLNGFLYDFLDENNSYPISKVDSNLIEAQITKIIKNKEVAILKSQKGRELILNKFNTNCAGKILLKEYLKLL